MLVVYTNSKVVSCIPPWAHKYKVSDPVETRAANSFLKPETCEVSLSVVYPSTIFQVFNIQQIEQNFYKSVYVSNTYKPMALHNVSMI